MDKIILPLLATREEQIKKEHEFAATAYALAQALIQAKDYVPAYKHLKDAVRLHPRSGKYRTTLEKYEQTFKEILD